LSLKRKSIGVMAPGGPMKPEAAEAVRALAAGLYPGEPPEIHFHPQCFLRHGHFAGSDAARAAAFLELAENPNLDAVWFGRGGYGSCRFAETVLPRLTGVARAKAYLGYSDAGVLLAGLYGLGFARVAHGPMCHDVLREGGEAAIARALAWLVEGDASTLEPSVGTEGPTAAFNLAILSSIVGTPLQPDLSGHVLMLEEVAEYMYRIDRFLFHVTSNPGVRRVAGIRLGRCADVPDNDPPFERGEADIVREWCARARIPYLGAADIGHDVDNKIVPFGPL
jgi:muramoyltetrapeptide carboxypeptidase